MEQVIEIHFSELQARLRCERKWFNQYRLLLKKEGPAATNLDLGRLWHGMVELLHKQGYKASWALWDEATGGEEFAAGDYRWLPDLLAEYHKWYKGSGLTVVQLEREIRVPYTHPSIPPGVKVVLIATVDRLYLNQEKQLWIGEDKTTSQLSDRHLLTDTQGLTYMLFTDELDMTVEGVMYVQARKTNPATARVPVIGAYPIPFPDEAKKFWAAQVERTMPQLIADKLALVEEVEPRMDYRFNPLPWMSCFCDFEELCLGRIYGRDASELYKTVSDPRGD